MKLATESVSSERVYTDGWIEDIPVAMIPEVVQIAIAPSAMYGAGLLTRMVRPVSTSGTWLESKYVDVLSAVFARAGTSSPVPDNLAEITLTPVVHRERRLRGRIVRTEYSGSSA